MVSCSEYHLTGAPVSLKITTDMAVSKKYNYCMPCEPLHRSEATAGPNLW